ncbi:MAG: DNA topoisomerase (ATP-hydrolyzing) subunit A [Anaerobiospirillum succiniciproducens]|uniref:DNA topoisomerase (ATP-hydrolyzing) subunit A n=1 Tax=Anaerobiospirillum succiniciproducens TaxID=13335 RepID=UPI0023579AC9|nr:DNA topoisomerase (ATP-hydrolyzing) subunit A [Anaerobiospirillum succiniciproducens]MCI6864550.1 DNA topoisomerase (ATP-hydrolyzing) subunit A [Anaerobiospirillum succiniciproducens]MDY2797883.1 DNA topoisomerase (ATP-hydrolyzing) subunit A [Anaerobiospirillum succiniciproducens]
MVDKNHDDEQLTADKLNEQEQQEASQETLDGAQSSADTDKGDMGNGDYQSSAVVSDGPTVKLEDELKQSFIDYAMSVIVDRALPDVRDGLKPVHRRVLYDMYDLKIWHNGPTKKSARVVGDVIGRFHPHGDAAVYETIVRMAQWFSMRAPLIFGQGNFGNLDGDGAAAMRYTEVRMTKIAEQMLADIDKETVNRYPNYDGNEMIPEVLPTRYPNLLVNGSSGIAVGMATNIPPHNLAEIIDGTVAMLDNPEITLDELMDYIPGPDFPTGGLIIRSPEIRRAYETGRGRCLIRSRTHTETDKQGRTTIYVDEIPYMVNKSTIVKEIAELVRDKKIEGIAEVNDLSDKDNLVRIAIDLKRDAYEEAVLNNLFQHTSMQSSFSFNVIALVDNRPKQLSLIEILKEFIKFRREVVTRRTVYLLRQDRRKAFLDEGLIVAKSNIQRIIDIVTSAANAEDARNKLMSETWDGALVSSVMEYDENGVNICLPIGIEDNRGLIDGRYHLSEDQAKAILSLQLHRLTHLATEEIQKDYQQLKENIKGYLEILNSTARMNEVIREELLEVRNTYRDPRRSDFIIVDGMFSKADLINRQAVLITLSQEGYIKYQDLSLYEAMNRGTMGNSAAKLKEEDFIVTSTVCNSHDSVMCFTNLGRCFITKVYDLPTSNNKSWRGRPVQNLFDLPEGESVRRILPITEDQIEMLKAGNAASEQIFIVFATANGGVKRIALSQFKNHLNRCNSTGIKAINLTGDDELVSVEITHGEDDILLFANNGRMMRFCEYVDVAGADSSSDDNAAEDNSTDNDALTQDTASASDDADESGDDDNISDAERIAREREVLARYLPVRKSGGGVRPRGRASGTNKGIKLMDGAKLAAMIVVPVERIEDEKLNYLIITESGIGKRGRLISLPGKVRRGGMGNWVCSAAARSERVVGVITADESSDYLIFSNTGSVLRSRVSDLTVRSRSAGYLKLKRCTEGELIVGMQEIPPAVVAEINESAEARAAEKRRVENGEDAVVTDPLANATAQDETNAQTIDTTVDSNEDNGATEATDAQNNTDI